MCCFPGWSYHVEICPCCGALVLQAQAVKQLLVKMLLLNRRSRLQIAGECIVLKRISLEAVPPPEPRLAPAGVSA